MKVRDINTIGSVDEIYDMPERPAILRAIKGEVKLVDDPVNPIISAMQEAIDELRQQIRPVSQELIKEIERHKHPETWSRCLDPLHVLIVEMFRKDSLNYVSIDQIREKAATHPYLSNFHDSIRQRCSDLIKQGRLQHYTNPKTGRIVPGIYTLPRKPVIIQTLGEIK